MIRKIAELQAALDAGRHVSRQALMGAQAGFRWALSDTNETVYASALTKLVEKGVAAPVATDICGEPYEYGLAHA